MSDRDRLQNSRYLDDYYPYRRWRDASYSPVERRYRGSYLDGLRQNRLGTYSSRYTSPVSDAATRVVDYDRLQSLRYYLNSLNFRNDDSDDSIRHSDPSDSSMYLSSRYATDESRYGRRHSPLHSRALDSHVSSPRSSRASEPYYRNPRFNSDSGSRLSPENSRYTSPRNSFNEERTLDYRDPQEIEPPNAFSIPAARESRMIAQKPRPVVYTKTIRDEDDLDSERESETQMVATKPKPFVYSRSITDEQMEALESRFGHHRCRRSRRRKWNCPLFKRREPGSNSFAYTTSVTEEEAVNLSQSVFDPPPRRRSLFNCRRSRRSREDNPVDDDELEHPRDHRRRPRSPYTSAASVQTEVPDKLPAGRNASTSVTSMERERIMGTQTDLYLTCSNFEKAISQVEAVMECIAEEENDKEPPPSRIPRMVRKRSKSTPSAIGKESPTIPSNPSTENSDK